MKPLVIIPARVGSKGVENKNFRELPDGSCLLRRAVNIADELDADYIITSDATAGVVAEHMYQRMVGGSNAQYLKRPAELCQDDTPMSAVVKHVLETVTIENGRIIVLLQPTCATRTAKDVNDCISCHLVTGQPVAAVRRVPPAYWRAQSIDMDAWTIALPPQRQKAEATFIFSGEAYVFRADDGFPTIWRPWLLMLEPYVNVDREADWAELCRLVSPARQESIK